MSERERYEHGVPCWVETLQPDPAAATNFYAKLFVLADPWGAVFSVSQLMLR